MSDVTTTFEYNGRTLEINTEMVEITTIVEPDPNWHFTDAAGHEHRAVGNGAPPELEVIKYPTLVLVSGPAEWCADCQDDHTDTWWVCIGCREKITPGVRSGHVRHMPGRTSYMIDGQHVDEATAREFVSAYQREINNVANDRGPWLWGGR